MGIIEYVLIMSIFCQGGYNIYSFIKQDLGGLERIRPFINKSFFYIRINYLTKAVSEQIKFVF